MTDILLILGGYLFGSISAAIVVCKLMGLPDPRSEGSRNHGTTNVLRIGGKQAAAVTLLGDSLKGVLPMLAAHWLGAGPATLAATGLAAAARLAADDGTANRARCCSSPALYSIKLKLW